MPKPVGGRGKAAPYKTVMVRVPEPIKGRVEELKELFYSGHLEYRDELIAQDHELANKYREELSNKKLEQEYGNKQLDKDEFIKVAKGVLRKKKSARESMLKLYTALFDEDITVEDLK